MKTKINFWFRGYKSLLILIFPLFFHCNVTYSQWYDYYADNKTFIELNYANSISYAIRNMDSKFNSIGNFEFNVGYKQNYYYGLNGLYGFFLSNSLFLFYGKSNISVYKSKSEDISSTLITFGFKPMRFSTSLGSRKFRINLYCTFPTDLSWTSLKIDSLPYQMKAKEKEIINDFSDKMRFGHISEGGIMLEFGKKYDTQYGINIGFERQIIYPRHKVLQENISRSIEIAANGVIFLLGYSIAKEKPVAFGLINFIFQNTISLGFQQLRTQDMFWPFKSEEKPISIDKFKIGFYINF